MGPKIFADRAKRSEIQSRLRKAQIFVWTAPDLISCVIVLAIILPKTDRANLEVAESLLRATTAAWAPH